MNSGFGARGANPDDAVKTAVKYYDLETARRLASSSAGFSADW
jgi:hypothetical protein